MSDPFVGEIRMVGFNFAPYGWALCQGQLVSIAQNQAVFALLGTTYGGNGTINFGLPDLQGRSPVGVGNGAGLSPVQWGQKAGAEQITLLGTQMPMHAHMTTASSTAVTVSGQVAVPATTTSTGEGAAPANNTVLGPINASGRAGSLYSTSPSNTTLQPFPVSLQGTVSTPAAQTSSAGGSLPVEVRNPYLGLTCIIALQGIYPTRQ